MIQQKSTGFAFAAHRGIRNRTWTTFFSSVAHNGTELCTQQPPTYDVMNSVSSTFLVRAGIFALEKVFKVPLKIAVQRRNI